MNETEQNYAKPERTTLNETEHHYAQRERTTLNATEQRKSKIRYTLLMLVAGGFIVLCCAALANETPYPVESYPKTLSSACREGDARVYDECGLQIDIVKAAQSLALETGKTTLVVYGAEWCVWCHIFDDFAKGHYAPEYFKWARDEDTDKWLMQPFENVGVKEQAAKLNQFVSENFVIAHIEGDHSPDGPATISALGFDENDVKFYPFIFSLNSQGKYVDHMLAYKAMTHDDTRKNEEGKPLNEFDRSVLLTQLKTLKALAQ